MWRFSMWETMWRTTLRGRIESGWRIMHFWPVSDGEAALWGWELTDCVCWSWVTPSARFRPSIKLLNAQLRISHVKMSQSSSRTLGKSIMLFRKWSLVITKGFSFLLSILSCDQSSAPGGWFLSCSSRCRWTFQKRTNTVVGQTDMSLKVQNVFWSQLRIERDFQDDSLSQHCLCFCS